MARIVAIGASQGGVEAIHKIVRDLPSDFPAAVLVVVHIGAGPSLLPSILNDLGKMPASHARDGEAIEPGHIYVAEPDHHLLVADGHIRLSRGPRENWTRPAIDPLFRTVAGAYGPDVIGVILTGRLNDGTAGLYEIKRQGGVAIVQDPKDAECPSMPQSALENADVDFCAPLSDIAGLLVRVAGEERRQERVYEKHGVRPMQHLEERVERPAAQTCPECGGAMREEKVGNLTQFRCHIGHVMTGEVLAAAQLEMLERDLSSVLRLLNERAALCAELADKRRAQADAKGEDLWRRASQEAKTREEAIRKMTETEWIRPERAIDASPESGARAAQKRA